MKRIFRKLLPLFLCVTIALGSSIGLVGCNKGESIDDTKTQLYIGAYGGGYGTKWLEELKTSFEIAYANKSFQDGKMGVEVKYVVDKDKYTPGTLLNKIDMANEKSEVFFTSGEDNLDKYLADGKLLDITEIVTTPLTEYDETKSIKDKLDAAQIAYYENDDKFYSLPDIETTQSIMYDIALFETEEYFFAKGGCPSEFSEFTQANNAEPVTGSFTKYSYTGTGEKSAGPDGKYGTYDDGCPATYEEFIELCQYMKDGGTDALVWFEIYRNFFIKALSVDYHGATEGSILYNGGGTNGVETDIVTGFDANGNPEITRKTIKLDNYEDVSRQAGNYYGLYLMEQVLKGKYYSEIARQNTTHVDTQLRYLQSNLEGNLRNIAMIIEGTWWETEAEASGAFDKCEQYNPGKGAREHRRFGLFPIPKVNESKIGEKSTILVGSSTLFAKANIDADKKEVVETFIRFVHSDAMLKKVTLATGMPKAFDYELTDTEKGQLSAFAKQYWEVSRASEKVYDFVDFDVKKYKVEPFNNIKEWHSFDGSSRRAAFDTLMFENRSSAEEYFTGMWLTVPNA